MWQTILHSKRYHDYVKPALLLLWYALMVFVSWEMLKLLKHYPINLDGVYISLPNIISTIGIISAILITFIFSKLYAEKSEIVARKKRLQQLSAKINAIRKITYILFIKNKFRKNNTLDLETLTKDIDDDYITYNTYNQTQYTHKDLMIIRETFNILLPSMQTNPDEFLNIEDLDKYDRDHIIENIQVINKGQSVKKLNNYTLRLSLEDYIQIFWEEHYILLQLNSPQARRFFNFLLFDLFVFVVLIIAGLIFLNISAKASLIIYVNQLIVSIFVATVIDMLKNILEAIRFEFKAYGIREW